MSGAFEQAWSNLSGLQWDSERMPWLQELYFKNRGWDLSGSCTGLSRSQIRSEQGGMGSAVPYIRGKGAEVSLCDWWVGCIVPYDIYNRRE